MTTFVDPKSNQKVTDLDAIIQFYKDNGFYRDLLALVPLQFIQMKDNINNLFYLIKIVRILKAVENLNVNSVVQTFKSYKDIYVMQEAKYRQNEQAKKH